MTGKNARELCLNLMNANFEEDVIALLKNAGYWDEPAVWRFYGDYENNYNTIGNQQSRPDAALVEKLVNSVDARLMNECLAKGLRPEDDHAPQDIQEAVARFFDHADEGKTSQAGRISDWTDSKRTEIARGITLAATGAKPGSGNPSFTIADSGEGQTPEQMPDTLLSLNRSNKLRIPFVQGKFNMGGTGVLKFCGKHNLQFVLSRRNPAILSENGGSHVDSNKWGFTVVRREDPQGNRRSSVYTYLAPHNWASTPNKGGVLRFSADELPLFPEGGTPYIRNAAWGTLIKLYEYSTPGFRSDILRKDGLLSRVDLLLPDIALPMRFHECRGYGGHSGSHDTTLTGVRVRLEDDKGNNLEEGFPVGAPMKVAGEEMLVSIYAFKKKGSEAYRKNEGIIFVVNGQTHGHLTQDFFSRKKVGLSYLADSILVIADCTKLSGRAREDLFMNSRDRLSGGELRQQIEESLEELLKQHQGLRDLKERRRREEIESKLDDAKPLEEILEKLLKQSPILSTLFLQGIRVSTPFKTVGAIAQEDAVELKRFPSYFRFKGKEYGYLLERGTPLNLRSRIVFDTDATNDYFTRKIEAGEFSLEIAREGQYVPADDVVPNLWNGTATLSIKMPELARTGEIMKYRAVVNDCSRMDPFVNEFHVMAKDPQESTGGKGERRKPASKEKGEDRSKPAGIKLPNVIPVEEKDWENHSPAFNKHTALRIKNAGAGEGSDEEPVSNNVYDFYINMDNMYLKSELKNAKSEPELVRAQYKYGMVLLGLAMLQQDIEEHGQDDDNDNRGESDNGNGASIEKNVEAFSRAVAPVVIPMINSLGSLSVEDESILGASGEAT